MLAHGKKKMVKRKLCKVLKTKDGMDYPVGTMFEMRPATGKDYPEIEKWQGLSNAKTWRGETAKRVKAELKGML